MSATGTYDALEVGDSFTTEDRTIGEEDLDDLVRLGGYTHPLFADPAFARRSPFGRRPLPGQALLLVMGGLVERTGRFDDSVVALLGFKDVRFAAPAFPGDTIHVDVAVSGKDLRSAGKRGVLRMLWTARNGRDEVLATASASMLFDRNPE